jgi:hypothetical protein
VASQGAARCGGRRLAWQFVHRSPHALLADAGVELLLARLDALVALVADRHGPALLPDARLAAEARVP